MESQSVYKAAVFPTSAAPAEETVIQPQKSEDSGLKRVKQGKYFCAERKRL